jgi:hypothetical protein
MGILGQAAVSVGASPRPDSARLGQTLRAAKPQRDGELLLRRFIRRATRRHRAGPPGTHAPGPVARAGDRAGRVAVVLWRRPPCRLQTAGGRPGALGLQALSLVSPFMGGEAPSLHGGLLVQLPSPWVREAREAVLSRTASCACVVAKSTPRTWWYPRRDHRDRRCVPRRDRRDRRCVPRRDRRDRRCFPAVTAVVSPAVTAVTAVEPPAVRASRNRGHMHRRGEPADRPDPSRAGGAEGP